VIKRSLLTKRDGEHAQRKQRLGKDGNATGAREDGMEYWRARKKGFCLFGWARTREQRISRESR